jgi:hypothetical protein
MEVLKKLKWFNMTGDANKVLEKVDSKITELDNYDKKKITGWGAYMDDEFTKLEPFILRTTDVDIELPNAGIGEVILEQLPNNKGRCIETQLPDDVDTFYDGKIRGKNGDAMGISIQFKAVPISTAGNVTLEIGLDLGGDIGTIFPATFSLSKGMGVEHTILHAFNAYNLDTWEQNGATVKISCINSDVNIYNVRYIISRTHKAK